MSATSGRPEYIERYAILNIVNDAVSHNALSYDGCVNEIIERIAQTQSADVVERKHGNWINPRPDSEMCSACGVRFSISSLFAVGGNEEPNYCPNCGADMRGEDDV